MNFENKGKWFKEIRSIDPSSVISKDGKYYHKIYGYEVELRDGKFHRANTKDNAQTRVINKKIKDLANAKDMNKDTNDNANIEERKKLVKLQIQMNNLIDKLEQTNSEEEKLKIRRTIKAIDDAIQMQKDVIRASHNIETDNLRTRQIPKMIKSKESIDDDSTSIFGDEPLDEVEDEQTNESFNDIPSTVKSLEQKLKKYGLTNPKFTGRVVNYGDNQYLYELKVTPTEYQRIRKADRTDSLRKQLNAFATSGDAKSLPFKDIMFLPSSKQNDSLIVQITFK